MALRVLLAALIVLTVGCYLSAPSTTTDPPPANGATVTFYEDVLPILQQHCQSCHYAGGIAPFPLMTYQDAVTNAAGIVSDTGALIMPPWGARTTTECTPRAGFKEDPSLTTDQIATLASWQSQGLAEGNPADAPPPITPAPPGLMNPAVDLSPPAPFQLPATENQDEFMCFVLDPKITTTSYIDQTDVIPGNSLIVHHALIFADPSRSSLGLITNTQQQSYSCFAGPGLTSTSLVAAWVPGGLPQQFPSGIAMPIEPNTLLVMQVHYHPHTTDPHNTDPDTTHFQMHYTSATLQYQAINKLIGNFSSPPELQPGPNFLIPADDASAMETMVYTIPTGLTQGRPTTLYSVGGHMHLAGSDIKVSLARAAPTSTNPADECLLQIPQWNFSWQRQYAYDIPDPTMLPSISAGDTLTVRCTYNNTMSNPALASQLTSEGMTQTQNIGLGESTTDEMCLAIMTVIVPAK